MAKVYKITANIIQNGDAYVTAESKGEALDRYHQEIQSMTEDVEAEVFETVLDEEETAQLKNNADGDQDKDLRFMNSDLW